MSNRSIDGIFKNKTIPCWLLVHTCVDVLSEIASPDQFDRNWKRARFLPWRFFYMDYDLLQQEIGQNNNSITMSKRLQKEWIKVHEFYTLKRGEIDRRLVSLQDDKRSTTLAHTFQSLLVEILELYRFTKLNYCGFLLLFKQLDQFIEPSDHTQQVDLRRLVISKPFWKHSIEYHRLAIEANYLYMTSPLVALKKPFSLLEQYDITAFINTLQQDFARAETDHDSHVAPPQQQTSINNDAFKGGNVGLSSSPSSSCSTHSCDTILSSETTQPQPQHRRKTYWVHPHNVLELILYLSDKMMVSCGGDVSHLPVVQEIGYPAGMTNATESQYRMTTVYMDTPHLTAYKNTSSMARVRWYESMNASSRSEEAVTVTEASHAMVEQKKYDSHTKQCWIQQRVWLKSKHLELWLSGSFSLGSMLSKESCQYHKDGYSANVDDIHEMQKSCLAVETEIHTRQIIPVLKVTKNRLVYASLDHSVTISIDTDIAMMRASSAKEPQSEQYPYNGLCLDDIVRFPYCVIQINTSTDNAKNSNKWLMDLMECSMLVSADGFSTYIHGVQALLGQQRLEISLPSWNSVDLDGYCLDGCLLAQAQKQKQQQQQLGSDAKSHCILQTLSGSSSRGSSRRDMHNRSTDTIATIITCYDDEINEKQPASLVESPTAIESPLLHPPDGQQQQRSGMRRSFDSYCSFDHPTSSRSDPTNCKSCIGKMSFGEHQSIDMRQHLTIASVYEKETITFSSFLLQTFWPRKFRSFEKEPLLASQHKRHRSATSGAYGIGGASRDSDRSASRVLQATLQGERFSRAAIFTMTCVVVSFSMSCILYITVLTKL